MQSDINSRLKALPVLLGVSVFDFCTKIGIKTQTYSAYQRGKSKPGSDVLAMMVTSYAINPTWLLLGTGDWRLAENIISDFNGRIVKEDLNLVDIVMKIKDLELEIERLKVSAQVPADQDDSQD